MKDLLFSAFYQGKDEESDGAGNCASVALIKAAMLTYGFDVFKLYHNEGKYEATLKNGENVTFTSEELAYAQKQSSFIRKKVSNENEESQISEIIDYAHLCFTVICKMAQRNGDYSSRFSKFIVPATFELAVEIINDGTFTPYVYEFLGLENHVSPTYRSSLISKVAEHGGMVMWTKGHAMFASNGNFDLYGNKTKLKGRVMFQLPGKIALGVFQLKN